MNNKKINTEIFIEKSKLIHNNKYDYSLTKYINSKTNVDIICKIHGKFVKNIYSHLKGSGCNQCKKNKPCLTNEKYIEKLKKIHGNKYDYSLTKYINSKTNVDIICKIHGIFNQNTRIHLNGSDCPKCAKNSLTTEEFINKSNIKYNNKFDYSKVEYHKITKNVTIICPIHGEFLQTPYNHLRSLYGCYSCGRKFNTLHSFIGKCKIFHGDKYDYSKTVYVDTKTKIVVICKKHGEFETFPNSHINGGNCIICNIENSKLTNEIFIEKAKLSHGDKYDYSLVNYINAKTKVTIVCNLHKIKFEQIPNNHLIKFTNPCPQCYESNGEYIVRTYLEKNNHIYIRQHKIKDCKNINPLPFDFYLPEYNLCIEYNGRQHYEIIDFFGGEKEYKQRIKNDQIKFKYCEDNNITLIIIKYNENIIERLNKDLKI